MALGSNPLALLEEGRNFSQLQYVLKLAHSSDVTEQQKAAIELSTMVEGTVFPAVSFGPLAHALCRLLPSENRTVAFYASRAVKILLSDDALRGQALAVGIPKVLASALTAWQEEVPCLREILAGIQTLTWDKNAVRAVLEAGALEPLVPLLGTRDQELAILTSAVIANILSYSDTLLLANEEFVNMMADEAIPSLLKLAQGHDKFQRCYATAALANACAHPVLAGKIKELQGIEILQKIETQGNKGGGMTLGGTRVSECAEVALIRLGAGEGLGRSMSSSNASGGGGGGDIELSSSSNSSLSGQSLNRKYTFKWGNKPIMELALDSTRHRGGLIVCVVLWIVMCMLVLQPVLRPEGSGSSAHL